MKLWDIDCEMLRDVSKPHRKRKLPQPVDSLVYDQHYAELAKAHLIRWVQVPHLLPKETDHG